VYRLGHIPLTLIANVASVCVFSAYLLVEYVNCASAALCGIKENKIWLTGSTGQFIEWEKQCQIWQ